MSKIKGHIEIRDGSPIFIITEDARGLPEVKKEIKEKISINVKKFRPSFITSSYKD